MLYQLLPQELLNRILEYAGMIKYRNGRYMNQLSKTDHRYALLQTIPPKKIIRKLYGWTYFYDIEVVLNHYSIIRECILHKKITQFMCKQHIIMDDTRMECL